MIENCAAIEALFSLVPRPTLNHKSVFDDKRLNIQIRVHDFYLPFVISRPSSSRRTSTLLNSHRTIYRSMLMRTKMDRRCNCWHLMSTVVPVTSIFLGDKFSILKSFPVHTMVSVFTHHPRDIRTRFQGFLFPYVNYYRHAAIINTSITHRIRCFWTSLLLLIPDRTMSSSLTLKCGALVCFHREK